MASAKTDNITIDNRAYQLHKAVFDNDIKQLSTLLRTHNIAEKDKHGNTALHLAVMLGRKECVQLLLKHDAPVKVKNGLGWSVLSEAVSYGHRPTISSLVRKLRQQSLELMKQRRPILIDALNHIDDFYMELKWDFQSWVPLVSRILPSDICRIRKCGCNIRMDSTLVEFNDMRWERGDITFLFNGAAPPTDSLTVMDNVLKVYQRVRYEENELEIEDEVDLLMSNDIIDAQLSTRDIQFTRAQTGWIFRADRTELIAGQYDSDIYVVQGLTLESRKRREHLSADDIHKNKAMFDSLTKGAGNNHHVAVSPVLADDQQRISNDPTNCEMAPPVARRASLVAPPDKHLTWPEYIGAETNGYVRLGRDLVYKESTKSFKATVAMSSQFPLSVDLLLNVLEVITPFKHFSKLRAFFTSKLPAGGGFPVQLELPILPTVTAKVTFQQFRFCAGDGGDDSGAGAGAAASSPDLFSVPADYMEDFSRFQDL